MGYPFISILVRGFKNPEAVIVSPHAVHDIKI